MVVERSRALISQQSRCHAQGPGLSIIYFRIQINALGQELVRKLIGATSTFVRESNMKSTHDCFCGRIANIRK